MRKRHQYPQLHVFLPLFILAFLTACNFTPNPPVAGVVQLSNLQPLPTPTGEGVRPLKIAIAAVISPQGSTESYRPLLDYLSQELGRPVEPVQRRTYEEVNELVRVGEVDLAFVCTSSYLVAHEDYGMQLLVAPQVHGETVYRAQIIVPADSPAQEFADLRGTVFAFTDPISFSGRMYPTYLLIEMGQTAEDFFSRTFFTYSHDDAIYAVAEGVADGASVDSLVLDFALKRDPGLASRVRVIHTSPPFGIPPVVVGPEARPQLRAQLAEILLNMHNDPQGRAALRALDYDRFVLVEEALYESALRVEQTVRPLILEEP